MTETAPRKLSLPWWTWVLPFAISSLATQASLLFMGGAPHSMLCFPLPVILAMVHWWGWRVLPGIFGSALLAAPFWGHAEPLAWLSLAAIETLTGVVALLLTPRDSAISGTRRLGLFLLQALLVPVLLDVVGVQVLLIGNQGRLAGFVNLLLADILVVLALTPLLLLLLTPLLKRRGWCLPADHVPFCSPERVHVVPSRTLEVGLALALLVAIAMLAPLNLSGAAFGALAILAAIQGRIAGAVVANFVVSILALALPVSLHQVSPVLWLPETQPFAYLTLIILSLTGLFIAQATEERNRERAAADAELRQSEARFRLMAENVNDVLWISDRNQNLTYVSPSVAKLRGFSPDEVLRQPLVEILTPESLERVQAIVASARQGLANGVPQTQIVCEMDEYHRDGTIVNTEAAVKMLLDDLGEFHGFLGVSRDISERKRAERERDEMQRRLVLSTRMAAVGRLAAGLAHEINNPLTVIRGEVERLAELSRRDDCPAIDSHVEAISASVDRIARITRNLRASMLPSATPQGREDVPMDACEVVLQTVELVRCMYEAQGVTLSLTLGNSSASLRGDPGHFQQVILNLLENSFDAVEHSPRKRISVDARCQDGMFLLCVADTGGGMSQEIAARVFDDFFTTKVNGSAAGLGLSVVRDVVTQMGGKVRFESSEGRGSTFSVTLPLCAAAPRPPNPPAVRMRPSST